MFLMVDVLEPVSWNLMKGLLTWYITLRSFRGRCHGNQLNLGDVYRWRQERPLLVALACNNRLAGREAACFQEVKWQWFSYIAYKVDELPSNNLEVYVVKTHIFAVIRPQFYDISLFVILAFKNWMEYHNFDLRTVIGNHFYTSCGNLVRFGSVIRSSGHKKLYSRRQKFFCGDFRYVQ